MSNRFIQEYFAGKTVWLTGASSGIGEQLAYQLNLHGAKLIISSRRAEELERVKGNMPGNKSDVHVLPLDLERTDQLPDAVAQASNMFGPIDILINNAGIAQRDFAMNTRFSIDRKIMEVNYFATILLTKLLLPGMLERKSGHIVVVSSMSGKYGIPRSSAYAASKHALHGFFDSLRAEIGTRTVALTVIIPGIINTGITRSAMRGDGTAYGKQERTQSEGCPPEKAALQMMKAIASRKEEAFVGGVEKATLILNRLFPRFVNKLIANHPIKKLRNLKGFIGFRNK